MKNKILTTETFLKAVFCYLAFSVMFNACRSSKDEPVQFQQVIKPKYIDTSGYYLASDSLKTEMLADFYDVPDSVRERWHQFDAIIQGEVKSDFLTPEQEVEIYIVKYAPIAKREMKKYGIPASVKMAQAILESKYGKSTLARENNNHFGIKCFSRTCKKGHCSNFSDDTHKDFFMSYQSVWQSFRAHSEFLQRDRYKHLHKLPKNDYKGWAKGLKAAGYATDKNYANTVIKIIEKYQLYNLDK